MADYYSVLARALSGLPSKTAEARRDIYQRARLALQKELSAHDPPFPNAELAKEQSALEVAIRRVEIEAASITSLGVGADHLLDSKVYINAGAVRALYGDRQPEPDDGILGWVPAIGEQLTLADDDDEIEVSPVDWNTQIMPEEIRGRLHDYMTVRRDPSTAKPAKATPDSPTPKESDSKLIQKKKTTNALALASKWSMKVLVLVAFIAGMGVLAALYIRGLVWVSEHIIEYLLSAAVAATAVCLFILAPLAFFAKTRFAAAFGFFGASHIFAVITWLLGFLTTLQYWGAIGVAIGLVLGIVGIVPIGMLASGLHTDWLSLGALTSGLLLTYSTRTLAMGLAPEC